MRLRAFVRTASIIAGILLLFFACQREGELGYATDEKALFLQDFLRHTSDGGGFKDRTIASLVTNDCKKPFLRAWQARYGQPVWDADEPYYNPSDSSANWTVPVRSLLSNELSAVIQFSLRDSSQTLTYKIALAPKQAADDLKDDFLFEYYRLQIGIPTLREGLSVVPVKQELSDEYNDMVQQGFIWVEITRCEDWYINGLYKETHCRTSLTPIWIDEGDLSWGSGDDDGGGSGGGFPGNGGGPGNNLPDDEPDPDPDQPKTPCDYANGIKNDETAKSYFGRTLDSAKLKPNKEFAMSMNTNGAAMWSSGTEFSVNPPLSKVYKTTYVVHSHPDGGLPVFSFNDVSFLWSAMSDNRIDPNNFFLGVVHPNSSDTYIMSITDADAFNAFCKKYDEAFTKNGEKGIKEINDRWYEDYYKESAVNGTLGRIESERLFLLFLESENTGISVSRGNTSSGFATWEPVRVDTNSPEKVVKTPCPDGNGGIIVL